MGWSIGYDSTWRRDIGYGVPATCDHPGCGAEIDRGLDFVCGGEPYGGEHGCGLYFCAKHLTCYGRKAPGVLRVVPLCERCGKRSKRGPFDPTPDTAEWIHHKLTDPSWLPWRNENPAAVDALTEPKG